MKPEYCPKPGGIAYSELSARGKKLSKDKLIVTFKYKKYRRLVRVDPNDNEERRKFLIERERKNMERDLRSPAVRNEYKLDED